MVTRLHRRAVALLVGLVVVASGAVVHAAEPAAAMARAAPVRTVPELALRHLNDDSRVFNASSWRGRVWVLSVWASWCGPCRQEHPVLLKLARMPGVSIVGLDYMDQPGDARRWLQAHGDPFTLNIHDPKGHAGAALRLSGVPETWLVDAEGQVRLRHSGPLTDAVLRQQIAPLLRELKVH